MQSGRFDLFLLYLMELCAGFSRGSFLVCIGWTTLVVTDDVAVVGQVFIAALLTNLIAAPIVGILVDRYSRKLLVLAAHFTIAGCMAGLGVGLAWDPGLWVAWIFAATIAINLSRGLYQGSHDGLIRGTVSHDDMIHIVARFRALHLSMTAVGTVFAGFAIAAHSPATGFFISAAASVFLMVPVAFMKGVRIKNSVAGIRGFLVDFRGGLQVFRDSPMIRVMALLAAIALPIGQLSNAILSSYIRDDFGRGSDVFGMVDGAWPVGGMAAAAVLSLGLRRLSARGIEFIFAALAGTATIAFALSESVVALAVLHAAMGFTVWSCRIMITSRVLQICSEETVGRSRTYIEMTFSVSAIAMCLSPTLVGLPRTGQYFLFWGLVTVAGTLFAYLWQRKLLR